MGYYTNYSLEANGKENKHHEDIIVEDSESCCEFNAEVKWYEHETDMKAHSKEFPIPLFTLTGIGEEPGDIWKKHFQNGKMQVVMGKIVYEEFDANKLV